MNQLRERPGTMKRFVDGVDGEFFFQKRVPKGAPDWLQTATFTFPSGRTATELVANDAAHLVWAVNLGVVDFNPWPGAPRRPRPSRRAARRPRPDARRALERRPQGRRCASSDVLEEHGLRRLSRRRRARAGIHVNVRIEPRWDFIEVRRAALALAREVERRAAEDATSKWWKEERHGVFVDYNQNARDRTIASGYSVRPTPDARVSLPAASGTRSPDVEPARAAARHRARTGCGATATRRRTSTRTPGSLDQLLELARRDEEGGLGDAPWPPHFPKQRGEPKRVQPSRARKDQKRR